MTKPTAQEIIAHFKMNPLEEEGGLFVRTYASNEEIPFKNLPARYTENKPFGTAILYLLTKHQNSFSALHRLPTDEIYHFYLGDPVELFELLPDGASRRTIMGQDIFENQEIQYVVPRNVWQGSRLVSGGEWALLGTTMAPGYSNNDFELGNMQALTKGYPEQEKIIRSLLR